MDVQQIIKKLEEEINNKNDKVEIGVLEDQLSKIIEELSINENFFNLPLINIFSIISKVNFNEIEEKDKMIEIIQNIIKNLINKHFEEKETILILQNLNLTTNFSFSFEEYFSILELITNCPILVNFCHLYKEKNKEVDIDYDYEIKRKEVEIEKLKNELNKNQLNLNTFSPITEKPVDYESDIFKACKEGKLSSVQWLIEKENIDKNKRVGYHEIGMFAHNSPIHIASRFGQLPIVQYLIEAQQVDIEIKGRSRYLISKGNFIETNEENWTPLHYACFNGHFQVVVYLISKGANIEATTNSKCTPLHFACFNGYLQIVEYLILNGAKIDVKDEDNWTPLHYACQKCYYYVIKYLIANGANKNDTDNKGRTPLDIAYEGFPENDNLRYPVIELLKGN